MNKVLIIYTGGTIGMLPADRNNPLSPLVPAKWDELQSFAPSLKVLPLYVSINENIKPIDSSDMTPSHWVKIAQEIRDNYNEFDGFVILHGTDTMTYTASALSFLLENLDKPVIITGSQISISNSRNDALQNLVTSLMLAAPTAFDLPLIPEVCIFFNNVLLRGNRSRKVSSSAYQGFHSPNFKPLGEIGEHIKINTKLIRKSATEGFFINEQLEQNVILFDVFPGMKSTMLQNIFNMEGLKGVVLRTFGAGNAPTDPDFLSEIEKAIKEKNLAVVNITQCVEGMVEMGLYDASAGLLRIGVISGVDMTPESALVKMQFLLGMGYDIETVKELMQRDLRGEQSMNVFNFIWSSNVASKNIKLSPKQIPAGFNKDNVVTANIRIDSVEVDGDSAEGKIELAVFMNYPSADENTDTTIPQCIAVLEGSCAAGKPINLIQDCTAKVSQVLNPQRPVQLVIVSKNGKAVKWQGAFLSVYTSVE